MLSSRFENLFRANAGGKERSLSIRLKRRRVTATLTFTPLTLHPLAEGVKAWSDENPPSAEFANLLGKVKVTVRSDEPKEQFTAWFTAAEVVAMFGDRWPDDDNIDHIRRCVRDRKHYPLPAPQEPQEKSLLAQGQTKKPGAHSESKHR